MPQNESFLSDQTASAAKPITPPTDPDPILESISMNDIKPAESFDPEKMDKLIEKKVHDVLKKHYPDLHSGVDLYDFMGSTEMTLYRALLVFLPFGFITNFSFAPVSIVIMIILFWLSGFLFSFIKKRKSSIIMYMLIWQGKRFVRILFILISAAVVYMTYYVADWYMFVAAKIQAVLDTIWENIQTLQNITAKTAAIKDGIVDTATNVGNSISNTANNVWTTVRSRFK